MSGVKRMTKQQCRALVLLYKADAMVPDAIVGRYSFRGFTNERVPELSVFDALVRLGYAKCMTRGGGTDPARFQITPDGRMFGALAEATTAIAVRGEAQ